MAHLATIARETRLLIKIGSVSFVVFLLLFFSFKGYGFIRQTFFPPPPAPPEQGFGKLPPVLFPATTQPVPSGYRINTIDGALPIDIPDRLNVYIIATPSASLLALQNVSNSVSALGYNSPEYKISDTVYQWSNPENGSLMTYDILTHNFRIDSNILSNINPLNNLLTDKSYLENYLKGIIQVSRGGEPQVDPEKFELIPMRYDGQDLVEVENPAETQFARVNLYQEELGILKINGRDQELRVYYPYPDRTLMSFLLSQESDRDLNLVQAEFIYKPIVRESYSTYPIKTPQQAFQDLQNGNAYIVYNTSNQPVLDITDVTLGYYMGKSVDVNDLAEDQKYLMPIYVFIGNNFMAYVSAIAPSSIAN